MQRVFDRVSIELSLRFFHLNKQDMNCKVGDKVRFLNDVGGGTVSRIINAKMVNVEDEDGFEIPVMISNIVVVEAYQAKQSATPSRGVQQTAKRPSLPVLGEPAGTHADLEPEGEEYDLLLAFVAEGGKKPMESDVELHLVNDSPFRLLYALTKWVPSGRVRLLGSGDLEPDSKEPICLIPLAEMHQLQTFSLSFILYKQRDFTLQTPGQVNIELNPLKFVKPGSFQENDFFDEKAYLYKVASSSVRNHQLVIDPAALQDAMLQKNKKDEGVKARKPTHQALVEEVDLHIESLVDNAQAMSNAEILEVQKARFSTALELALRSGTKRMVFIHGIGNGKLKHEIRKVLDMGYVGKVRYQDASFEEYGYGATMVLF